MTDPGSNGVLSGMIADRRSLDDEELPYSLSDTEVRTRPRKGKGRVRRKLRWKPAVSRSSRRKAFSEDESVSVMTAKSNSASKSAPTFRSTATPVKSNKTEKMRPITRPNYSDTFEGVSTIESEGELVHAKMGTSQSVHTFHSTATPVKSNKTSEKKRLNTQPNYSDTFEVVSSIESEGNPVHSKMTLQDSGLQRSQTLPKTGADFQTLEETNGDFGQYEFDPFGIGTPPKQSPKQRRRRSRKGMPPPAPSSHRFPNPGESPPLMKETIASPPNLVDSSISDMSMSFETALPMLSTFDFETDDHSGFFTANLSPLRPSPSSSPTAATPTGPYFTPERRSRDGCPPILPIVKRTLRPPSPIGSPDPGVAEANSEFKAPATPDLPDTEPEWKLHHRPMGGTVGKELPPVPVTRHDLSRSAKTASEIIEDIGTTSSKSSSPDSRKSLKAGKQYVESVDADDVKFLEAERNLRAIHEMAGEHLAHSEFPEALEVFEEILRGQKERFGPRHYRVGTALHNLGVVHLKARQFPEAVQVCKEAVSVRKEALVPNHPEVAVSLAQLGVAQFECKKFDEALVAFRQALTIQKYSLGPKHPKVGKILHNIGCALYELGEMDDAKAAFQEALEIQQETLRSAANITDSTESNAASNQIQLSIASTQSNIGSIKLRSGNLEEANIALEEALLIQQSVLGDNHPTVLNTSQSINQIDLSSDDGDCFLPLDEMLESLWSCGTTADSIHDVKNSLSAFGDQELQDPGEGPLDLVQLLDLSNPKRWYRRVMEELATDKPFGNVLQVDDNSSSVRDLAKDSRVEM